MTDYTRRCIWEMPAGSNGQPDVSARRLFANLERPSGTSSTAAPSSWRSRPTGDLIYADYDRGEIRRIHYYGANVPPVPSFTATPSFGPSPLHVDFDASGSTDAERRSRSRTPGTSTATASTTTRPGVTALETYTGIGDVEVGLQVSDPPGATRTTSRTVSVANGPPTVTIDSPHAVGSAVERRRRDLVQRHRHRHAGRCRCRRPRTTGR